ncbi:hypothetical protein EKG38_13960 [Shewanella canadensis]|uniref:Uncharacterized protein n=1 Tax=Shewanella canadensis TaxID=271096 RepID=A0A431WU00_9GAMM|nr:hypothetical protein [Shewanella canadensis]RTR38604.1 hypothetical protein EKG38_13960 [Shewanella canadensis]
MPEINTQNEFDREILLRLHTYNRGQRLEVQYQSRGVKRATFEQRDTHEKHIALFNSILVTALNGRAQGYELPGELTDILLEYMVGQAAGEMEEQVIVELRKINFAKIAFFEGDEYRRATFFFLKGHRIGREQLSIQSSMNKESWLLKYAKELKAADEKDLLRMFSGYKDALTGKNLKVKDVDDFLCEEFLLQDKSIKNRKKNYMINSMIREYLNELKAESNSTP